MLSNFHPTLIIANVRILTMDSQFRYFENGHIIICNDKIEDVKEGEPDKTLYPGATIINGMNKLAMPGLVNTHTHVPMTIFRGYADDLPLYEWLYEYIFPIESEFVNAGNVETGTRLAIAEMLRSGTTTFNDMYYYVDVIARIVELTGIRAVLSEGLIDFPAPNSPTPRDGLNLSEHLIEKWNHHPRITIAVSAHAPYSCSDKLMQDAWALSQKHKVPINIHVAETRKEFDESLVKTGKTPVGHLYSLGLLSSNLIIAHGVHLTPSDIELLAENGVSVAHNPECNMKLASGVAPVPQLLKAGVKVGFGTDGVASNNNLDLFEEMNTAAILHKMINNDPTILDARTVVEMATIGGARVLGMDKEIGSLEPGKKADIILLDMTQPHAHPVYNIYSLLVYSMQGSDVDTVIIDGEIVMENRGFTRFSENGLFEKTEQIAATIRERSRELAKMNGKKLSY